MRHLLSLATLCTICTFTVHSCPDAWFLLDDHCYILYPSPLTLSNARQTCKQLGDTTHLISVKSQQQKQNIVQLIEKYHQTLPPDLQVKVWTSAINNSSHYRWPGDADAISDLNSSDQCSGQCCGLQVQLENDHLTLLQAACDSPAMAICVKNAHETEWTSIEFVGRRIDSLLSKQMAILSTLETASFENQINITNELTAVREALDVSNREVRSYMTIEAGMMMNLSLLITELREESSLRDSQSEQIDRMNNLLLTLTKKSTSLESKVEQSQRFLDSKIELVLIILRETKKILAETINSKVSTYSYSQQGTLYNQYSHCFNYSSSMIIILFCFFFTLSSLILTVLLFKQLLVIRRIFHFRPILGFHHEHTSSRVNDLELRARNMQLARD